MKMNKYIITFIVFCITTSSLHAEVVVIDGDTLKVSGEVIRIIGIDAPETLRAKCKEEKILGEKAKDRLYALLREPCMPHGSCLKIYRTGRVDAYGRTLAEVSYGDTDIASFLLTEELAKSYLCRPGKRGREICPKKNDWCDTNN